MDVGAFEHKDEWIPFMQMHAYQAFASMDAVKFELCAILFKVKFQGGRKYVILIYLMFATYLESNESRGP